MRALLPLLAPPVLVLAGAGCAPPPGTTHPQVILLGIDGADLHAVRRLGKELPHLSRLIENGSLNHLRTEEPIVSPPIWTTIATGRARRDHGIWNFFGTSPEAKENKWIVSDRDLRAPPLWEILPEPVDVAVVNWWATWPAQPVHGVKLSNLWPTTQHIIQEHSDGGRTIPFSLDSVRRLSVFPPEALEEFARFERTGALPDRERELQLDPERFRFHYDLPEFYAQAEATVHLLETRRPRFAAVYFWILDHVQHNFFNRGQEPVERFYREMDETVGRIVAAADPGATFVIVSDHGFKDGDPEARRATEHHRDSGIILVSGGRAIPGARARDASIYDITPTILHLFGVAPSEEMPGRILDELFHVAAPPPARVARYERTPDRVQGPETAAVDEFELERLKSLGYVN